jgi:UDP-N-acetylglucosamine--N-acetylmuramyl-(pentapeptide) pyrophosphoryl-undecaprenol N-acetylglucosamine transferase
MERYFPFDKICYTGNPVRQDLIDISNKRNQAISYFNLNSTKETLLILGGSLGARRINQLINSHLDFFSKLNIQILWQCGSYYYETYRKIEEDGIQVHSFLNRMDLAYAASDFIISRAGALSVSELCLVGKPVIFIPSPNVSEDHQTKNAKSISTKNAAILIKEEDLDKQFKNEFNQLINSKNLQSKLSKNIKSLAKPNATKDIIGEIEKLLKETVF